jgi:hypothetical protein
MDARQGEGLVDIAHEELELIVPDVIRHDHIVVDQFGG